MRDRVSANLYIKMRDLFTDSLRAKLTDMDQVVDYMLNGTGFLASSSMFGAAVLKMNNPYDPDILLEMKPIGLLGVDEMFDAYNYNLEVSYSLVKLQLQSTVS